MQRIPDKSIDMILCDLPYETTNNSWDSIIPFDKLWEQYERVITNQGAIVLTANGSFTYKVISSNIELYKYKWIWLKNKITNFVNAKNKPMTAFEEVLIFSKGVTANGSDKRMNYNPQGLVPFGQSVKQGIDGKLVGKRPSHKERYLQEYTNYPNDVLKFDSERQGFHPTQKPVALFEYLIKTYTNKGDIVLDNCMGSGTTAVAALNTERNYIGFETNKEYYEKSLERIKNNTTQLDLFE
ncbi:site-specific DNA-methyltransferase [Listeria monocytogenes]|nr:site-specific DNA-methyltransferase [Listeria monocytogenes]